MRATWLGVKLLVQSSSAGEERRGDAGLRARQHAPFKLFRAFLGRAGRRQSAVKAEDSRGFFGVVCPQSHKMAVPQQLRGPAPAQRPHLGSASARGRLQHQQGTAPQAPVHPARQEKHQPPLGTKPKGFRRLMINNDNNNSFRTGEQRHTQTRAALVHSQGPTGRKRGMDRKSLREESG